MPFPTCIALDGEQISERAPAAGPHGGSPCGWRPWGRASCWDAWSCSADLGRVVVGGSLPKSDAGEGEESDGAIPQT